MAFNYVYFDYFNVLNMPVVAGRNFSSAHATDSTDGAIINETAARKLGLKNPIGAKVNIMVRDYTIIGVVKDGYQAGYNTAIAPAIFAIGAKTGLLSGYNALLVKLNTRDVEKTTAAITGFWKTVEPAFPLKYSWLDEDFGKLITKYERFGKITTMLGIISFLIALMGIFALSAFTAGQRTKEIGVRKVFGASIADITALLSKNFILLVIIALAIAFPAGYWLMAKWLQSFAYRINISWLIFASAGGIVLFAAVATVSAQAIKAAIANPIKSLRTE
jgi:putative ABC transport system permease protein